MTRITEGDLVAGECPEGHLTCPPHPRCPTCGAPQEAEHSLADAVGTVLTWTTNTATPPGVRTPNHVAIVAFDVDGREVRTAGQLTRPDVEIGDRVRPVAADDLRDPDAGIREAESQSWSGYRFDPV
ncbi:MAG: Zn-ribbon domain-containing OB-fold protein [Halobacteriaceae archaeon]